MKTMDIMDSWTTRTRIFTSKTCSNVKLENKIEVN